VLISVCWELWARVNGFDLTKVFALKGQLWIMARQIAFGSMESSGSWEFNQHSAYANDCCYPTKRIFSFLKWKSSTLPLLIVTKKLSSKMKGSSHPEKSFRVTRIVTRIVKLNYIHSTSGFQEHFSPKISTIFQLKQFHMLQRLANKALIHKKSEVLVCNSFVLFSNPIQSDETVYQSRVLSRMLKSIEKHSKV
jgi:hypothetical protein